MGLKSDSHTSRYSKDSTRGAKGKQDVITKQVIETTRCTIAEAEEALTECNFDVELAVNYIFDRNGDNVWTETKNRKTKKIEEEVRPIRGTRGRGGRGRGTSSANRGEYNSETVRSGSEHENTSGERFERGRGRGGRGRGGSRFQNREDADKPVEKTTDENVLETEFFAEKASAPPTTNGFHGKTSFADKVSGGRKTFENSNYQKKDGQYEVKRPTTEPATVPKPNAPPANTNIPAPVIPAALPNKAGPLSYAALLASGSKKPQPPPSSAVTKPVTTTTISANNVQSSSTSAVKELTPVPETQRAAVSVSEETQASSASETAKHVETTPQSLTSQLKNDLGLTVASSGTKNPQLISSPATSSTDKSRIPIEYAGVEGPEGSGYQFGPATGSPMAKPDDAPFASSNNSTSTAHDFSRSHEADMYKSTETAPLPKQTLMTASLPVSAPQQMNNQHVPSVQQTIQGNLAPRRNLGYAETNSVTINPLENRQSTVREIPPSTAPQVQAYNKPAVTAQSSLSHQHPMNMHHQGQQQQQMYNPMYNSFPYMNLYSPLPGREDQNLYANPYMSYAYGMDMNSIAQVLPQLPMQPQLGHQPQTTHRNEHLPSFNDKVQNYGQANAAATNNVNPNAQRENPTSVPPPPGFSGPPASLAHHNMFPQNMFSYPVQMSPFVQKMPGQMNYPAGNDEGIDVRHQQNKMYGGQPDKYSNGRDRMNMGNAQPTPPPPQQGYGQQGYGGNPQMNAVLNKKFHTQWNN